ncbi:MAG: transporter substrate-binding domain-containing protein [Methylocystaceae bacterium]|nr:transporter substrate-binding domain-containing protein [Methylocystaceae bacterium]
MRHFFYVIVFIVYICSRVSNAFAQEQPIRIGIFDFPPFFSKNAQGKAYGTLVDLANRRFAEIGRDYVYQIFSPPVMIERVINGDVDVIMTIKHPALEGKVLYSKHPIGQLTMVAYHDNKLPTITDISDFAGKKVIVINGYGYGGYLDKLKALKPAVQFVNAHDIRSGLEMLMVARGEYFLSYLKPSQGTAYRSKQPSWLTSDLLSSYDGFWVVSKKAPHAEALLKELAGE